MSITYQILKGWKYRLVKPIIIQTEIYGIEVDQPYFSLTTKGLLTVKTGYASDGATGVPDSPDIMEGAFIHDCLCQMQREGFLDRKIYFEYANRLLVRIYLSKSKSKWKKRYADIIYRGVSSKIGKKATYPEKNPRHKIITIE